MVCQDGSCGLGECIAEDEFAQAVIVVDCFADLPDRSQTPSFSDPRQYVSLYAPYWCDAAQAVTVEAVDADGNVADSCSTVDGLCVLRGPQSALPLKLRLSNLQNGAVPGIDALFIGPSDLAADMGHLGNPGHPDVQAAIKDACARCARLGKPMGTFSPVEDDARRYLEMGMTFAAAIIEVLRAAPRPRTYREVTDEVVRSGRVMTHGRTPHRSVARCLYALNRDPTSGVRRIAMEGKTRARWGTVRWVLDKR